MKRIDALYAELPTMQCRGLCQESCGPIAMSKPEWTRIITQIGHAPEGDASLVCPMLDRENGKCRVYDARPMICRLWGLVKSMRCPHGCVPSRWVGEKEGHVFLNRVDYLVAKAEGRKESSCDAGLL